MRHGTMALATVLILAAVPAAAQESAPPPLPEPSRWFFGGGLGLGFGDVDRIELYPLIGYRVNRQFTLGGGLTYRYLNDDRFAGSPSTKDYGANLFARYHLTPGLFLEADYEHLSHEFVRFDLSTGRDRFDTVLGGVGYSQPAGGRASVFVLALYDFTYEDDPLYPYADPWIIRGGIATAF